MAAYAADIQLQVKGKAQLNQLEQQLQRVSSRTKELSKALNFNVRQQTVRLDTRAAMTAVRALEDRINRLGRTITVRLRTIEDARERRNSDGGGTVIAAGRGSGRGGSNTTTSPVVGNAIAEALSSRKAITAEQARQNRLSEQYNALTARQSELLGDIAAREDRMRVNRTEARNIENGFGTPKRLNQLNFGYASMERGLNRVRTAYQAVTTEVAQLETAERNAQAAGVAAVERKARDAEAALQRKKRNQGMTRAAGAGAAAGAINIGGPIGGIAGGAAAGFLVGGPAGAAVGAGVTAAVQGLTALGTVAKDAAEVSAQINKMRMALASLTGSDYAASLQVINNVVRDFNEPLDSATEQFTRLAAAGRASGLTIGEMETVYRGLAAANKALGGDSERLQGILLATTQVFSKGKVQAEELRGQIGERLPGAFALFAQSVGKTPAQLDKSLELGEVSILDFVKFSERLLQKYEKDAKKIADSPEEAGARLQQTFMNLKVAMGPLLADLGAKFQDFGTTLLNALIPVVDKITELLGLSRQAQNDKLFNVRSEIAKIDETLQKIPEGQRRISAGLKDANGNLIGAGVDVGARLRAERASLLKEQKRLETVLNKKPGKVEPPGPRPITTPSGPTDKELEKIRKEWERNQADLAKNQAEYDKAIAQNRIEFSNAVFDKEMALERQKYDQRVEYEQKLRGLREAELTGGSAREVYGAFAQAAQSNQQYDARRRELEDEVKRARQELANAKAGVGVAQIQPSFTVPRPGATGPSGRYIQGGYGPKGPNQYGAHFDIKRSDGSYFGRNALDQYVEVNGKALSSGYTVPGPTGGAFGASRDGGTREHRAWDFAFGGSASLGLKNGAKWISNSGGSYGDNAVFQTPDGKIYRIIHGKFSSGAGGAAAGATAASPVATAGTVDGASQVASAQGNVDVAQVGLDTALAKQKLYNAEIQKLKQVDVATAVAAITQSYRDQTLELTNATAALQLRNGMELEGINPTLIEGEVQKLEISQRLAEQTAGLNAALEDGLTNQEQYTSDLAKFKEGATAAANAVDALTQAQLRAADPITQLYKQWNLELNDTRSQIASLAGTVQSELAGAMSNAITGVIQGTTTVQEAFGQMFANIGAAFIDMATQMIAKALILKVLGIFGGAAGGGLGFGGNSDPLGVGGGFWGGGRASGGPVEPNTAYLVGEEGPELILPQRNGYVLNADQTQNALAQSRGALGGGGVTSDSAFSENRDALNTISSTSRERQVERWITSGAGSTEIKYSRVGAGDLPFVTEQDMLQATRVAAQEGARMGQQRTMAALKNNPGARRTIGI